MPVENRIVTAADGGKIGATELNELQDKLISARQTDVKQTTYQDSVNAEPWQGATVIFGEWTIAAVTEDTIDDTRDWRRSTLIIKVCRVAAANELPSGANHDPTNNLAASDWTIWNTNHGATTLDLTLAYNPWGNTYIYAEEISGDLMIYNSAGVPTYDYLMIIGFPPLK